MYVCIDVSGDICKAFFPKAFHYTEISIIFEMVFVVYKKAFQLYVIKSFNNKAHIETTPKPSNNSENGNFAV